ncbi:general odorant-binding protein 56h-like [Chelonus insularis]|uniref:general odorant-binding protein 56h-like n=1 Tax=Chelonus insularis TaxID=460826 RepID=UPI00158E9EC2|nr:general odorant-binding protein 56h-like [Chelonus insularis]
MRFVIFAAIVCFCVVGALAKHAKFEALLETCTEKLKADPEAVKALYETGATDDAQTKCVLACTMQEDGSMNEAGEVNKEKILDMSDDVSDEIKGRYTKVINECVDERDDNECQTAYKIFACVHMKLKQEEE